MPDLLVVAPIETSDPERPRAGAVLVRGGIFARVGTEAECAALAGRDVVRIEAGGGTAGLGDAHGHVALLGRWRREVRCGGAAGEAECAARAAARARDAPRGAWIRGSGWDQNRWPGARFPTSEALTRAVPDHPAALSRVDGHALWVNEAALAQAGISAATADPPGGRILRGAGGRPSGVLLDAAQELVLARIPPPTPAELERSVVLALGELVRSGLTSVHDAGVPPDVLEVYRRLAAEDRLPVRVYAMLEGDRPAGELAAAAARAREAPQAARLSVGAAKLFADGALGSRGAALHEDYADEPGNRGLLLASREVLRARVIAAARVGLQPAVHAIGDRAVAAALDALEAAAREVDLRALRPRLEHLQVVRRADVERVARLGAIASMQPVHAASDAPWLAARLGAGTERLERAHPWRSLLAAGVPLAFGSDFPVEEPDPRAGLAAAEARTFPGTPPFGPDERLDRRDALAAFTRGAAVASFAERRRGMVREGLEADLTLFDVDVGTCSVEALRGARVTCTVVGGRIEHGPLDR